MKLLCVVDMQRGFVTPENRPLLNKVIPLIEHFYLQNNKVVFTKFHNTSDSPYCDYLGWRGLQQRSERALLPELDVYTQRVFLKYGYSVWTEAFSHYIEAQKITQLYFVGLDTDACIYESALQTFDQHIQPIVIEDACMSSAGIHFHQAAIQLLKRQIGENNVVTMQSVISND